MKGRKLKKKILELLGSNDLEKSLDEICQLPARQAVNPLFSFFYSTNELIKWRAITAMGAVVSRLAEQDMESARVVMRRLIWNLNDESGGIGWSSPEAMGEIMARHFRLAEEYAFLLVSYVNEQGMSTNKVITSNIQFFKEAFSGDWGDLPIPVPGL
jgi:hypothetical protein